MKADLHTHSMFSPDALSKPDSFARFAKNAGLGAIALTDHNTTRGWGPVRQAVEAEGLLFIPGEEIKVYDGPKCAGEILGLFLNEHIPAGPRDDVLDRIRQQDALAFVAHPFDWMRHPFVRLEDYVKKVDGIEVHNAGTLFSGINDRARRFAVEHRLPGSAGSDAHLPGEIGRAWIETDASDLEGLRFKMKQGAFFAHGGYSSLEVHFYLRFSRLTGRKLR